MTNYIGGSPQPAKKITILFLAANPKSTDRLRLDEEVRTIDERLRLAQYRDKFNLQEQWAVRTGDILDAMLRYQPDIVHFSGHGSTDGALIFEDASGAAKPVSAAALGALFEALEGVRCVVMNACWSATHAGQIAEYVDCVVGMSRSVSDAAGVSFAAGFYRGLGDRKSVAAALKLGKAQIMLDGSDEQKTPRSSRGRASTQRASRSPERGGRTGCQPVLRFAAPLCACPPVPRPDLDQIALRVSDHGRVHPPRLVSGA